MKLTKFAWVLLIIGLIAVWEGGYRLYDMKFHSAVFLFVEQFWLSIIMIWIPVGAIAFPFMNSLLEWNDRVKNNGGRITVGYAIIFSLYVFLAICMLELGIVIGTIYFVYYGFVWVAKIPLAVKDDNGRTDKNSE